VGATYGKVASFYGDAFGVAVSRGGLARAMHRLAGRLQPTYQALLAEVRRSPVVYPDETSMRISGLRGWLWAFVTKTATVYVQRMSRGTDVVEEILGRDFHGALVHDGWAPYDQLALADHQQCFAHLLRRTKEMLEIATRGAVRFPRAVRDLLKDALALRDRRDAEEVSPHGLAVARGRLENRFEGILDWRLAHDGNRKLQRHLRLHADQIFTFLRRDDVEATAWPADHATRPAVLFRKISGGHRSPRGAHTHDVLLSVYRTCRQRLADAFALTVRALHTPAPRTLRIAQGLPAP
jgi:transposase